MQKLEFKKPGLISTSYNLFMDDLEIGSAKYLGFVKNILEIKAGEKSWELRRTGIFNTKFFMRAGHDPILNYFMELDWKGKGRINLGKRQFMLDYDGLFYPRYFWKSEDGEIAVEMIKKKSFGPDFIMEIRASYLNENEIMTLAAIMFYLILRRKRAGGVA